MEETKEQSYGFTIDFDDFEVEGNNRIFSVRTEDKEAIDKFIKDNNLFEE